MPYCARCRSFDLKDNGSGLFALEVVMYGPRRLLQRTLDASGLVGHMREVATFGERTPSFGWEKGDIPSSRKETFNLVKVDDTQALKELMEALENRIVIDLGPAVDECYALGPYKLIDDGDWSNAEYGELANRAKFFSDIDATERAAKELTDFASRLPAWQRVDVVTAPPKSSPQGPDVSRTWAQAVATSLRVPIVSISKVKETVPQMPGYYTEEEAESEDEQALVGRMKDSMKVAYSLGGQRVLVIDNTVSSGGTLVEAGRALKAAGASAVYGLSLAKNAKYTNGGMSLFRGDWP